MFKEDQIDWNRVDQNLRCPFCNEKASIAPETDGTEGFHTHRFPISREWAKELSQPTTAEAIRRKDELLKELGYLNRILNA
jgi:hypothetical protein